MIRDPSLRLRWPLLAVAGALAYAASLLISAPASVFAWGLASATHNTATLERPQGSLWRGQAAALILRLPGTTPQRFDGIAWNAIPMSLLKGRLGVQLTANGAALQGTGLFFVRLQSMRFAELTVTTPASTLAALFPMAGLIGAGGRVSVRSHALTLAGDAVLGRADLAWADASTKLSPVTPLGSYRAALDGTGAVAEFKVWTEKGALQIAGSGRWTAEQGLRFSGEARGIPAEAAALEPLLQLFGPPGSGGARALSYSVPAFR